MVRSECLPSRPPPNPPLIGPVLSEQSLYIFVVRLFIIGWECANPDYGGCKAPQDEFSYFTVLTYWGLGFYFLVAAVHTFTYARAGRPLLDRFPRILQALHALFYTTIVTFPFLVTIVYWGILYKGPWFPRTFNAWSNVSQHLVNSFLALFEVFVPRTDWRDMRWVHMLWLLVVLALYLCVAYITRATKGFYTYTFLDPGNGGSGKVAGYVLGIAVAILVVFLIVKGLVALRMWLTEKVLKKEGKFARQPAWREDVEMHAASKP